MCLRYWPALLVGLLVLILYPLSRAHIIDHPLPALPDIDGSCNVDADCIDMGGGSCDAGCTWPVNKSSADAVDAWLDRVDKIRGNMDCYMDCPRYSDPVCIDNICKTLNE
ncbi:MAG: hypothetical protein P8J32_05850 [bacterium]|jgi:hypothetical protein|nr:hypothetical protein [bacterium]